MTRRWNICDLDDNCLAQIEADSDIEALNKFSTSRGYAPYREAGPAPFSPDGGDPSEAYRIESGRLVAVFENFELMVY